MPYFVLGALGVALNLWLNVGFNHWWAGGNFALLFNTFYSVAQYFLGSLLMFEVDSWLSEMKFIRLISLMSAVVYSVVYGFATFKMFENSLDWDKEEPDFLQVYYTLFLAYNLIMNIGTEFANLAIIFKEFSLEYF